MILGIDIGGANTKIASDDGKIVELDYIPLWKNTRLPEALLEIAGRLKPEKAGVVITGELAACFPDKEAGRIMIILPEFSESPERSKRLKLGRIF